MLRPHKKLILIDPKDTTLYPQRRKKQRRVWLSMTLLLALLAILSVLLAPWARANDAAQARHLATKAKPLINSPQLVFQQADNQQTPTLPVDQVINVNISGLVAYVNVQQVFINPYAMTLSAKYQFPLPEDAAVKHLTIKVADKEIIGKVMVKQTAQALYQQAKQQGKKASLVTQQRPNLFSNQIANIPAQSQVVVRLEFIMPVNFQQHQLSLNLPLAITNRYHSQYSAQAPDEHNVEFFANQANTLAKSQASITLSLNAGAELASLGSNSHPIVSEKLPNQAPGYLIRLADEAIIAHRDFNLHWQLQPSETPQVSSFSEKIADDYYTLLTIFPPHTEHERSFARDIIFIIDTSGSMQGASIVQAKASLQLALLQLSNADSFNIIAFNNHATLLFNNTKMATRHHLNQALQFINSLQADGGTEMYRPLSQALVMNKAQQQMEQALRQIVFITDGAVANEFELMQLLAQAPNNTRLFTVGIGAAPNGYFMKKAAQFGRGSATFIQQNSQVQRQISELMTKISQPAMRNIKLTFDRQAHPQLEVYPKSIPDLYLAEPLQIAIKSALPINSVQIDGETASSPWYQQVIIADNSPAAGIASLWARDKIADLIDTLVTGANTEQVKAQVIATSLAHQILSPYTSFIAIEKQRADMPLQAKSTIESQLSTLAQAHENLLLAMPKTALGWQLQCLFGAMLIVLALLALRWRKHNQQQP
ncbi:Ca-activated chloride channel family protein [Colwellia chukchiensis]|uniref:Ca-activated chloride channel family protein n=1 Tax=Colwellia chukchiensis TaxID=641665 RepID=A0A1H7S0M9_9GAMM|nr:marine proteobacterial sortase target protein [Colwellia chukchiensis]SEL65177.1 Ca-activated chloride channel family protein [Colwellia chukchiensis]